MRETLERGLPELGVDAACIPALESFSRALLEKNQVMNLTAITEPREVATLHLLDSLALISPGGLSSGSVVDVGTGAGFPGVPLAIALPESRVTLLDSLGKRITFLQETCEALGLKNTVCIHSRAEDFAKDHREAFDAAVSRAVAGLPILCELCLPLVKVGGRFLAMKSSHEEIGPAGSAISALGGRIGDVIDYQIPTTGVVHRIVCIEKIRPTPKKYPRRFAQIKKQPL